MHIFCAFYHYRPVLLVPNQGMDYTILNS